MAKRCISFQRPRSTHRRSEIDKMNPEHNVQQMDTKGMNERETHTHTQIEREALSDAF